MDMARTLHRLTAVGINRLKAPGLYSDGGNLNFRVADGGSRSWVFRFAKNGRTRDAGLGPYPEVSLAGLPERGGAGLVLATADLVAAEKTIGSEGVRSGEAVCVAPAAANGTLLAFVRA